MKYFILALMTSFLWLAPPAFSDEEVKCKCDQACTEACAKGEGNKKCDCKVCDCAKTGKCSHGKCEPEAPKKEKPKK